MNWALFLVLIVAKPFRHASSDISSNARIFWRTEMNSNVESSGSWLDENRHDGAQTSLVNDFCLAKQLKTAKYESHFHLMQCQQSFIKSRLSDVSMHHKLIQTFETLLMKTVFKFFRNLIHRCENFPSMKFYTREMHLCLVRPVTNDIQQLKFLQ